MTQRYHVKLDGKHEYVVEIGDDAGNSPTVRVNDVDYRVDRSGGKEPGKLRSLLIDDRSHVVTSQDSGARCTVQVDGVMYEADVESERDRIKRSMQKQSGARSGPAEVRCDMAGIVVSVAVKIGDTVAVGDPLLVVEAMKMENEIRATSAGTVTAIQVSEKATVLAGDLLVTLKPPSE